MRAHGFPVVVDNNARLLVLGSLPGRRSIDAAQYYAHPRNVFWQIVEELFGIPRSRPYRQRLEGLTRRGAALWDVLRSSRRAGSLDSAIQAKSAVVNDFQGLFDVYPRIELVAFNGRKASELYRRLVAPSLSGNVPDTVTLPSTSPAHASMPYPEKLRRWSEALLDVLQEHNGQDSDHRAG